MISKLLFERTSVPDLEKSLDVYSARQKAIANNIANVDTPEYKAQRVNFEEEYKKYLNKTSIKGKLTNEKHIPTGVMDFNKLQPQLDYRRSSLNDSGINNVDIDREMAELAKNNMRYEMSINLIKKKFANLKSSIKGR